MQITVQGNASASFAPEQAVVHLTLGLEGPDKVAVVQESTALANEFAQAVDELRKHPGQPVSGATLSALGTRSWRPHSAAGEVLPPRHAANATATVTFSDVRALSAFIDQWSARDGITVNHVEWSLTEDRRAQEESTVLARAVADARHRAQTMASAAGAGTVRFVELADPGLLSVGREFTGQQAYTMKARGAMFADEGVDVSPEDVELGATVHARFTAE